jgi:hypothetical protein
LEYRRVSDVEQEGRAVSSMPVVARHTLLEAADGTLVLLLVQRFLEEVGVFAPEGEVIACRGAVRDQIMVVEMDRQLFAVARPSPLVGWALRVGWPVEIAVVDEIGEAVVVLQVADPASRAEVKKHV